MPPLQQNGLGRFHECGDSMNGCVVASVCSGMVKGLCMHATVVTTTGTRRRTMLVHIRSGIPHINTYFGVIMLRIVAVVVKHTTAAKRSIQSESLLCSMDKGVSLFCLCGYMLSFRFIVSPSVVICAVL